MAKLNKNINYSDIFKNLDEELSSLLDKSKNGKNIESLKPDEREKLWTCMFNLIKKNNIEKCPDDNISVIKNSIEFILSVLLSSTFSFDVKKEVIEIVKFLNSDEFLIEDSVVLNILCKINEYWLTKMNFLEVENMEYLTLKHLLNLCLCEKPLVGDIQRLGGIRKAITATPFDKTVPSLRPLLVKLVQKLQILNSEHGQKFLSQALILSYKIMTEIHKTIMLELSSCTKKKAADYGKIYVMAWHIATEDIKSHLEKNCFQHIMETILKEQRTSLELNKNSQNILAVLEVWHSERKKKNPDFITMITISYQPILWKYLRSGFNVHRCNATDVFFKAFPLQRTNDNAVEAEKFFNEQFSTMVASLTDECHIVRIIGIREVCNILSHYWNSFNPIQIHNLMSIITKQCANDASSAEVRRMVYIGLQSLVKSPLSCDYIKHILPNLSNNIHDVNQRVRIEFIKLLICIKEKKDPNFKYCDMVSMYNIQHRLGEDNIAVGQWIVKLLLKNYYHSKMPVLEWTKRFIYLIKTYKNSYRNFFFYSNKSLPFLDACTIIYEILSQLGGFVISKSTIDQENENILEKTELKKRGGKKLPLSNWNKNEGQPLVTNNTLKKCAFDDAEVVSGLLDIVTILWVLHDVRLNKPENEEVRFRLYDTYIKYAQPFINYYKDCSLFLSVLSLSGNIPASLLRSNSITLPGYCLKMLKSIKMDSNDEDNDKIISMLIALVKWGRGSEILEQVNLWLDAAFETQNMNETILPRRKVKINETIQPNSIVAIYILDTLLKKEYVKLSILKKNYVELFNLWKFMFRIRKLIEVRLDQGEPFSEELVSDQFLILCFRRYVKLIPLLKEDDRSEEEKQTQSQNEGTLEIYVNRQKEMESVIEWAEILLLPLLQQEELEETDVDLISSFLEDIFYVADNMIIVHFVNNFFHFKTAHFILKILGTKYGIRFVKSSSRVAVALNYSAKLLFKISDDLKIFSTVIPSLMSHTLNVLAKEELTIKDIEKIETDMPIIKTCFWKILFTYQDNLKSTSSLKENVRQLKLVVGFFVDCITNITSREIPRQDSSIPLYTCTSQLPSLARFLLSLFFNKKTWTPLFLHVLSTKFTGRSYNIKTTISAILILHLYAISDKKVTKVDLKKATVSASKSLTYFKQTLTKNTDELSMETETTTKKTWPSTVAVRGYSSSCTNLCSKSPNNEQNFSKEARKEENSISTDLIEENLETSLNFYCKEDNFELNLMNCGFELIKKIESFLEKIGTEAQETS